MRQCYRCFGLWKKAEEGIGIKPLSLISGFLLFGGILFLISQLQNTPREKYWDCNSERIDGIVREKCAEKERFPKEFDWLPYAFILLLISVVFPAVLIGTGLFD